VTLECTSNMLTVCCPLSYSVSDDFSRALIERVTDQWTGQIKDEMYLISTELKNYNADGEREGHTHENGLAADGPIPEVLLNR
jgi:hypothetical protein